MNKYDLYFYSLMAGLVLTLIGAVYHVRHLSGSGDILGTALLLNLYWFIMGLTGIFRSTTLRPGQRVLWLAGFLMITWFAGLLWYFREIKPRRATNRKDRDHVE